MTLLEKARACAVETPYSREARARAIDFIMYYVGMSDVGVSDILTQFVASLGIA